MGGGAMRTAAKAAALAGYRSTAARRAPNLPTAASASSVHVASEGEKAPLISSVSSDNPTGHPAMVQLPAWDIDDWEFAGGKEEDTPEVVSDRMLDRPLRLVFGPAPTLEEAEEATADLKEAIEKVYFSGTAEDSIKVSQVADLSKSTGVAASMPKHVVQAFSLLQGSPEAQAVVASLACDKNVWDSVMKNDKVMEFFNKHQSVISSPESDAPLDESTGESERPRGFSDTVESSDKETSEAPAFFTDFVQNIKVKVSEMVSNISGFFQDFMGASSDAGCSTTNTKTSTSTSTSEYLYFLALAVAAILIVLVKRG